MDNNEASNLPNQEGELWKEFEQMPDLPADATEKKDEFQLEVEYFDESKKEGELWRARTGLTDDTLCGAIETIIFMSERPVPIMKIRNMIDPEMPLRVIHESIVRLQEGYETTHHGLRLMEVAEGWQFRTKATYAKYVQDLLKVNSLVLTPSALEVLAIIAYKQPVSKTDIDKIRGVDSSHIVRALMDKRLVKVVGRSEDLGRPTVYGTTIEFLEVFNLSDISQLPPEHELESMATNDVGRISDIRNLVGQTDKARFSFDEIEELDKLTQSIKSIAAETSFTKSLEVEDQKRKTEEGVPVKSAFELLEEFVQNKVISDQNKHAILSELITTALSPAIVNDLEKGPYNTPDTAEDEAFEMIDLETGEKISADQQAISEALSAEASTELAEDFTEGDVAVQGITEKTEELEELTEDVITKASDLDLDLGFLREGFERINTESQDKEVYTE